MNIKRKLFSIREKITQQFFIAVNREKHNSSCFNHDDTILCVRDKPTTKRGVIQYVQDRYRVLSQNRFYCLRSFFIERFSLTFTISKQSHIFIRLLIR